VRASLRTSEKKKRRFQRVNESLGILKPEPNDFEILGELGKGTFGLVKLVRDINTKELYALKMMKKTEIIRNK
jgi:serine/threonine protein kinase